MLPTQLHGIDFTSAPSRRKAITVATGTATNKGYSLHSLTAFHCFSEFEHWLHRPGRWIGVFDMPFSLPRELVETLGWPTQWALLMEHFASLSRAEIRATFQAFCNARPSGRKFAHRDTETHAGSSSSMKWVNPPVAYMLHAGVPRLVQAGVTLFGLHPGDTARIALEGYPGLIVRSITKHSYKNDDVRKQTEVRRAARLMILKKLQAGDYPLGVRLDANEHIPALLEDGTGDLLDAAICGLLAAWAWERRETNFGLPVFDPLEGWIVGA